MKKRKAVMDTSFWSCAVHTGVHGYLDELFEAPVWVPRKVDREILKQDNAPVGRIYPYQKEYEIHKESGRFQVKEAREPLEHLDGGENEAIALAQEEEAGLLINESRGYEYGRNEADIFCINVPFFIFVIARYELLGVKAAKKRIRSCTPVTSESYINDALDAVKILEEDD